MLTSSNLETMTTMAMAMTTMMTMTMTPRVCVRACVCARARARASRSVAGGRERLVWSSGAPPRRRRESVTVPWCARAHEGGLERERRDAARVVVGAAAEPRPLDRHDLPEEKNRSVRGVGAGEEGERARPSSAFDGDARRCDEARFVPRDARAGGEERERDPAAPSKNTSGASSPSGGVRTAPGDDQHTHHTSEKFASAGE